jgi:hypothetical protein
MIAGMNGIAYESQTLPVDEFLDSGELKPSAPVEWRHGQDCPVGFRAVGSIGDAMMGDTVAAEVFQEAGTGRALVYLGVCGVTAAILCLTRVNFLRFTRDWLEPLAGLNQTEEIGVLTETLDQFREFLEEAGDGFRPEWAEVRPSHGKASGVEKRRKKRRPESGSETTS